MKALVIITGRGLGGDAVGALNLIKGLENNGVHCEIALDSSAPGIIFEKEGLSWHKISIPQAGGHAATKASSIKAAFKMLKASIQARNLIKKLDVDFVVGFIGGGAIVASVGAKLARKPAVSLICTPLDTKVCTKLNYCYAFPETAIYREKILPNNVERSFFPIDEDVAKGDGEKALSKLREIDGFDENKKTILFSSGSSIFKGMIDGINSFAKVSDDYNLILIGLPLEKDYLNDLHPNIIYLGYIDWLFDLFNYIDLAVLTDDGLTIQEAMACEMPSISLTRIKWGRYHNMAGIFEGSVLEADNDNINEKIFEALNNLDELKKNSKRYSEDIRTTKNSLSKKIIKRMK